MMPPYIKVEGGREIEYATIDIYCILNIRDRSCMFIKRMHVSQERDTPRRYCSNMFLLRVSVCMPQERERE